MIEALQTFLALLAVATQAALVALLLLALVARGALARLREALAGTELWLASLVAAVATAGSLLFSEVAHYAPCELCWYQRIAMYPLALTLPLAARRGGGRVASILLPLPLAGAAIAVYHYQLEWFPDQATVCTEGVPCSVIWFRELGYVTLPMLALTAFLAIAALLVIAMRPEPR